VDVREVEEGAVAPDPVIVITAPAPAATLVRALARLSAAVATAAAPFAVVALVPERPLVAARPHLAAAVVVRLRPDAALALARPVAVASRETAVRARALTRPDEEGPEDGTRPAQIATTEWVTEASLQMQDLGQSTERSWSKDLWVIIE